MPIRSKFPDSPFIEATVPDFILKCISGHDQHRVALKDASTGRHLLYGEINNLAHRIASGLRQHGVRKGDLVSLCLPNCIQYPVLLLAVYLNGAYAATVSHQFKESEFYDHFETCGCRFVITVEGSVNAVSQAARKLGNQVQSVFVFGKSTDSLGSSPNIVAFDYLLNEKNTPNFISDVTARPKSDLAWLPSSSGTTGKPKCVMLSHFNVVSMIQTFGSDHFPQLRPSDHVIGQLPMYHMYGFTVMWLSLVKGATMIVMSKFEQRQFLELVQHHKVPILYIVPPILVFLAKNPMVDQFDISSVHTMVVRSAPISKELSEETMKRHRKLKNLLQAFGMSEIGAALMIPPGKMRHGSCGVLMPNFQAKIVDVDTGKELKTGQPGELYLKGDTRMLGYWKNPKATAEAIDSREGWLRTGDMAYNDQDGYFFIVDRLKEMIKVNAYQVAPAELEGLLLSHPSVQDAAVYGVPHPDKGEVPRAMVVPKKGTDLTSEVLSKFVDEKVAAYKRLAGGIELTEAIPKSPSGKILRRILRQRYASSQKSKL